MRHFISQHFNSPMTALGNVFVYLVSCIIGVSLVRIIIGPFAVPLIAGLTIMSTTFILLCLPNRRRGNKSIIQGILISPEAGHCIIKGNTIV